MIFGISFKSFFYKTLDKIEIVVYFISYIFAHALFSPHRNWQNKDKANTSTITKG